MLSCTLALLILAPQASNSPMVTYPTYLEGLSFFLDTAEPSVIIGQTSIAFAPTNNFTPTLVISQGGKTLQEVGFRTTIARGGAFASVGSKVPGGIPLGTENGERTFEYRVDGKLAGKFSVNLTKTSNGDPLDPKVRWKIVGPWKDLAYIKHKPDDGSRQDVYFTYWVAQHELQGGEKNVTATLKKGATVVASSRDAIPNGARYSRFEVPLLKPNKDPLMVKDLPKLNGSYVMEVTAGKRVLRSWKVSISGGEFVAHPRSALNGATPETWLPSRVQSGTGVNPFTYFWLAP